MATYLTVDLGGTKIATGFVTLDDAGQAAPVVEDLRSIPTEATRGGDDILRRLAALAADRVRERDGLAGVGIGSAGVVADGTIVSSTDLIPGWTGQYVARALAEATGLGVGMVNDVVAHGLGEAHHGAGRGHARVLSVGVGTGIGGAIIEDGRPVTGAHAVAGHIGHIAHGLGRGVRCSCGTLAGHIEPVASGTGLATLYNLMKDDAVAEVASGKDVSDLAAGGDAFAAEVIARSARALGEALGGAVNLLDPDVVVVSGSVASSGALWWDALRAGFADGAMALTRTIPLLPGELGGAAPLVGAAVAAAQAVG